MDWQAVSVSVRLALFTTLLLLVIGIPIAYGLATSTWRLKWIVEACVALPLVLPPTVLGFYLLQLFSQTSPLGRVYHHISGENLPFSFFGLLLGSVIYSLPFAVQPFLSGFAAIDRDLVEASWCLGVSRFETFFRLILPLSSPSILTGMILSFAHTLGEFGVVLMIGGNIRGVSRTISISIYDDVQAMNYSSATKTSLFLLVTSFVVLGITSLLKKRGVQVWN